MPSFVIPDKCDGCKGEAKTTCVYICPNDLMVLDPDKINAYNQEPDQCRECFSCGKIFCYLRRRFHRKVMGSYYCKHVVPASKGSLLSEP